ncbi:integrase arm-type DNA-binding domain-containing protein [Novosphingobium sp. PASSN1]|uniref:tyrosine-type recombinase/integrase n=1 Tax=Novosphingobium sp. PASSN1 TaxID=2015561 RepID=UPI000BD18D79|nr:integrase arm-type DNA-binding domain-containing protein [Novosphingobium sp. PASSN1]OYU33337.1 MAG: integrase [Novosphingobium sp. PASSN1]
MGKLTATGAKALTAPGRYSDGGGLELLIGRSGAKSWVVRVQKDGKRRDIGAGSFKKVSLADARKRAERIRSQIEAGIDPVAERRKEKGIPTFRSAAALVHAEQKKGWKNGKHTDQWINTLTTYAFPAFGDVSVAGIDAAAVRDVLAAIWLTKPETARRLRQRIGTVIDWAVGKGYREASLAWPVINKALPKQRDKAKHHAAMPYADLRAFMQELRSKETMGRLALEAQILTAGRSGEVRGALWPEIDLEAALWTIPAERMKGGQEHVVPLSGAAVALFGRMKAHKRENNELVFPGTSKGKPLSDMTLTKCLRDMGLAVTAHGFRSTFADWINEQTSYPREVREAALAHVNQNKVEAAYSRTAYLDKRRPMMAAWADYCTGSTGGNVVQLLNKSA